jgi:branched-chain amino acid aminotransferase
VAYDIFSKNGRILPMTEATVPLSNIEFTYGFGVYENIRVVKGTSLFLKEHAERLMLSAKTIGLEHELTEAMIAEWTDVLVETVGGDALNLKILLIGGRTAADAQLFILPLTPLFPDRKLYSRGIATMTVEHERFLPHAKTLNMLPSYLAYRKAKEAGCYDALLINRSRCITEGTRTNFFCIRGTTLYSPPKEEILEGVTLLHVLEVAEKHGYKTVFEPIPLKDVSTFDGAFLTSTSSKIMPIARVDETEFMIPEELKTLMKHFDAFLDAALRV